MSDYVLRRGPMRDVGSRYFNDRGPMTPSVASAARFLTAEDAERQRARMKEPALWEVLPATEAEQRERAAAMAPRSRTAAMNPLGALLVASAIQDGGPWMGDIRRRK